jgi:hypothetical protein
LNLNDSRQNINLWSDPCFFAVATLVHAKTPRNAAVAFIGEARKAGAAMPFGERRGGAG